MERSAPTTPTLTPSVERRRRLDERILSSERAGIDDVRCALGRREEAIGPPPGGAPAQASPTVGELPLRLLLFVDLGRQRPDARPKQ